MMIKKREIAFMKKYTALSSGRPRGENARPGTSLEHVRARFFSLS